MKAAGGLRSAGTFPSVKPYSKPFNRNIMKQKKIRRQPQKKPSPRQQKPRKREDGRPQGEKEAILQNYRGRKNMGFTLDGLKITQRVYVFGQGDRESLSKRFAKDVCNPAIHNWTIA